MSGRVAGQAGAQRLGYCHPTPLCEPILPTCCVQTHQVWGRMWRGLPSSSNQRSRACAASIQLPWNTGGGSPVAFAEISAYRIHQHTALHRRVSPSLLLDYQLVVVCP